MTAPVLLHGALGAAANALVRRARPAAMARELECDTFAFLDLLLHKAFVQILHEGEPAGRERLFFRFRPSLWITNRVEKVVAGPTSSIFSGSRCLRR
jgi:hypothetical protein